MLSLVLYLIESNEACCDVTCHSKQREEDEEEGHEAQG